jgi:hypothetical protein
VIFLAYGGMGGLRGRAWRGGKISPSPDSILGTPSPEARCHTDYVVPVLWQIQGTETSWQFIAVRYSRKCWNKENNPGGKVLQKFVLIFFFHTAVV